MVVSNEHRRERALATLLVAMGALLSAPVAAQAQALPEVQLPKLQLQRFRPAPGPADFINVYGSPVPKHLEWDFGAYLDFADDPLNIATAGIGGSALDRSTVDEQLTLSLIANIGLGDQFEVGLLWPITLFQTSDELQPILLNDPSFSTSNLQRTALNDPRITGKWRIVELAEHGYGLALVSALYLPLANQNALTSDGGVGAELLMAADAFLYKGVRGGANAGFRYRPSRRELRGNVIGNEIIWGLAASIPMFMEKLDALVELDGAVSVATRPDNQSCCREGEVYVGTRAALRYRVRPEWSLTGGVGAGATEGIGAPDYRVFLGLTGHWVTGGDWGYDFDNDGIYGSRDLCPDEPEDFDGFEDDDGCPDPDNDGDGVVDALDKCPNTPPGVAVKDDGCPDDDLDGDGIPNDLDKCPEDPEDFDGFEDGDGCPDPDNDGDGIPDSVDLCPNEPETFNGFEDEDGCPDNPNEKVVISKNKLIITEPVYFAVNKEQILSRSFPILQDVARVLKENPQIKLVRIEGHTDDRGRDQYNLDLSKRRAESVRTYLIKQGIVRDRLQAVGYGKVMPIADNETEEGRAKNRRVEFTIVEQD